MGRPLSISEREDDENSASVPLLWKPRIMCSMAEVPCVILYSVACQKVHLVNSRRYKGDHGIRNEDR
jgi:hypothetical protein